jgi:transglutaminase-like putative cysteine protease
MELIAETTDPGRYLDADEAIDHRHPLVRETAARLRAGAPGPYEYAERAFGYVRDAVAHSADAGDQRVTWRASDALEQRTGICYAKAHALAALLRAEGIPAGLCYQRLTEDDGTDPVLHGLIALRLPGRTRWSRVDPRGNKPGVDARFQLDRERLAWPVRPELGERDYPTVYAAPAAPVLAALRAATSRAELVLPTRLPDPVPPS